MSKGAYILIKHYDDSIIGPAWVVLSKLQGRDFIRLSTFLQNICENKPGEVNSCESRKEKMTPANSIRLQPVISSVILAQRWVP